MQLSETLSALQLYELPSLRDNMACRLNFLLPLLLLCGTASSVAAEAKSFPKDVNSTGHRFNITSSFAPVCKDTEYCSPDDLKCLTPTNITCASDPFACAGAALPLPLPVLVAAVTRACRLLCGAFVLFPALLLCSVNVLPLAPTD